MVAVLVAAKLSEELQRVFFFFVAIQFLSRDSWAGEDRREAKN